MADERESNISWGAIALAGAGLLLLLAFPAAGVVVMLVAAVVFARQIAFHAGRGAQSLKNAYRVGQAVQEISDTRRVVEALAKEPKEPGV